MRVRIHFNAPIRLHGLLLGQRGIFYFLIFNYTINTRGSFPGIKQAGREADHSPSSRAEVEE
jgi:hypothetical protein